MHLIFVRYAISAYNHTILPMRQKNVIWQKLFFMVKHDLKQGLGLTL